MSTDYETYSTVYGCDTYGAGLLKLDWMWALTRIPNAIGTPEHQADKDKLFGIVRDKLFKEPWKDPSWDNLRPTEQSVEAGCKYT